MKKNVYFVSGIDTNIGKSYATAYLARVWREKGINVITQKFIQTGNPAGYSEDIELHRRLMGLEYLPEDEQGGRSLRYSLILPRPTWHRASTTVPWISIR